MNPWLPSLAIAYLLGSIPFGYLLVRMFLKQDIRATGSGNIGATNVARSGSRALGIATLVLDLVKGALAVWIADILGHGTYDLMVLAGVCATLGHVFPVWLRFRGGKGVATALGVFLGLAPLATLCGLVVFLAVFLSTRYVSLASIAAAAVFPIFGLWFAAARTARTPVVIASFVFIPLLIIVKHHQNIARLIAGTESRFGAKKVAA
jgi:glycerol-3-phosphate acyltransferase PlsY